MTPRVYILRVHACLLLNVRGKSRGKTVPRAVFGGWTEMEERHVKVFLGLFSASCPRPIIAHYALLHFASDQEETPSFT